MTARILRTWAEQERIRRARNRFLAACVMLAMAVLAGYFIQ